MVDWPKHPVKKAGGQLPVWVEGDEKMNESCAILRYLGSKYGYTPIDPLNAWMSDVIIDMCSSLYCKLNHSFT